MRKKKLLILTLICAAALTGCKKKAAADLASLHTTAAVETETMPLSTEAPTTAPAAESSASNDKNTNSTYSLKADIKTSKENNLSIEYPELSNMKDTAKQKEVNELLKHNALAVKGIFPPDKADASLSVKATVESSNLKRITVSYSGEYKAGSGDKASRDIFYTNTIDLETAKSIGLSAYADAYTVAGYIASGDYKFSSISGTDENAVRAYINSSEKTTDYYYKLLGQSDFNNSYAEQGTAFTESSWPKCFSYEKQGVVYIAVPASAEPGAWALIKYSPDNK